MQTALVHFFAPAPRFVYLQRVLPAQEYQQRLQVRESTAAHHEKLHVRCGNIRLAIFALAAVLAWESMYSHRLSAWWLLVPLGSFLAVAVFHSRVLRARDLARRAVAFYANGLARIEDRWAGTGQTGERFADPHHVYAADLDLFGRGSLFELLSTARTRMGEEQLARWLLTPSRLEEIRERQGAVAELRNQIDLREDLAVLGEDASVGVHPAELIAWAETPARLQWPLLRWLATVLAALAVLGVAFWFWRGSISPFLIVVLVEAGIVYRLRTPLDEVLHGAEHALHDLDLLSGVLGRVEREKFRSERLRQLQHELESRGMKAAQAIALLRTISDLVASRDNMLVRVIDVPLMYSVQVALIAERWRRAYGSHVRAWLAAVAQIEALLAFAAYSCEHPADPFPEIVTGPACFVAEALGHPLMPQAACVRNSVRLCDETRALLVSGSNMSGKSTLLRAAGISVVLAMAGAPVRAEYLRLSPLWTGASIRINDSLQEGSSRFYAEITRLRQLRDLADGDVPLLFLLDELLQGTNSNDRRIGAEGIVRALVARGAIGLLTTHDLALTEISEALNSRLRNVHFQDQFIDGKITFDYRLREGVVTKSNGLDLMRSIGLDV